VRACYGWRGSIVLSGVLAVVSMAVVFVLSGSGAAVSRAGAVSAQRRPAPAVSSAVSSSRSRAARSSVAVVSRYRVPLRVGAQVLRLRRRDSDTFWSGSGRLVTRVYATPVNYRTATGRYVPINTTLSRAGSGSGFVQAGNDLGVRLPA
jgi:hypothetical protein